MQDMKQIEYMYASQIPAIQKIIEMFMKSVELRRSLIGPQHQVSFVCDTVFSINESLRSVICSMKVHGIVDVIP